jgi:hemerythrin-like metal-binding protein
VLFGTAEISRNMIRAADFLARWGGEEFAVLTPETDLEGAASVAEKIRAALAENEFPGAGKVTASFGVAEKLEGETIESWFRRADQSMYRAKSMGRNCVACSNEHDLEPLAQVRLVWHSEWNCGIKSIDEQHRMLLSLANELIALSLTEKKSKQTVVQLKKLLSHIVFHFEHEERIQTLIGFPGTDMHAEIHHKLVEKAMKLQDDFMSGVMKPSAFIAFLLDEVIVGHLLYEDVQFFPYTKFYQEG